MFAKFQAIKSDRRGMTLVEVIVAMTLIALVAVFILPVFAMSIKSVTQNRARLIATSLASQYLEDMIAQTTAANYSAVDYGDYGPSGGTYGLPGDGNPITVNGMKFYVKKSINWYDDPYDNPAGGGADPMPFDYKIAQVTVESPSCFSGTVCKYSDFKTVLPLEAEADAQSGIVLTIVNGRHPTEKMVGVPVTFTCGGITSAVISSNPDGQILFPIPLAKYTAGVENLTYTVKIGRTDMMFKPQIISGVDQGYTVTAPKWRTVKATIEADYSGKLTVNLPNSHRGARVVMGDNLYLPAAYIKTKEMTAQADTPNSIEFSNLWPAGSYSLTANIKLLEFEGGTLSSMNPEECTELPDGRPPQALDSYWSFTDTGIRFDADLRWELDTIDHVWKTASLYQEAPKDSDGNYLAVPAPRKTKLVSPPIDLSPYKSSATQTVANNRYNLPFNSLYVSVDGMTEPVAPSSTINWDFVTRMRVAGTNGAAPFQNTIGTAWPDLASGSFTDSRFIVVSKTDLQNLEATGSTCFTNSFRFAIDAAGAALNSSSGQRIKLNKMGVGCELVTPTGLTFPDMYNEIIIDTVAGH